MSGAVDATGYPDAALPTHLGAACDPVVGYMAAFAVASALLHAPATGEGQYVELSQLDAFTVVHGQRLVDFVVSGEAPHRWGNGHRLMAPHGCYPCRGDDRYVTIAVRTDEEWARLVRCMGSPVWAAEGPLAWVSGRREARASIDQQIGEWTRSHDAWELARALQASGVAATPVQGSLDLIEDQQMMEREFYQTLSRDIVGSHDYPWYGFRLSRMENRHRRPPPLLGEHNSQILEGLLGLETGEYEALIEDQVIGFAPAG
jgi:crotonobetainyl-CoA:carnitine CoA-transferase CaiB-like acyl-CoA transferase